MEYEKLKRIIELDNGEISWSKEVHDIMLEKFSKMADDEIITNDFTLETMELIRKNRFYGEYAEDHISMHVSDNIKDEKYKELIVRILDDKYPIMLQKMIDKMKEENPRFKELEYMSPADDLDGDDRALFYLLQSQVLCLYEEFTKVGLA